MKSRLRIAFIINFMAIAGFVLMGLVYSLSPQPMPYHLRILGGHWANLSVPTQSLILALLHGSGLATLSASASLMFILWFPWRQGARWARVAVPLIGLTTNGLLMIVMLQLQVQTGIQTPWPLLLGPIALLVLAAFVGKKRVKTCK